MIIQIPKGFYIDHFDRDLPAPPVIKETTRHYFIDTTDDNEEDFKELCSDTEFYCTPDHFENCYRNPALALRKSIIKQGAWPL